MFVDSFKLFPKRTYQDARYRMLNNHKVRPLTEKENEIVLSHLSSIVSNYTSDIHEGASLESALLAELLRKIHEVHPDLEVVTDRNIVLTKRSLVALEEKR